MNSVLKDFLDNILLFSKKPVDIIYRLILFAIMILGIVGGLVLIYDLAFFNFQYFLKEEHLFFRVYSHLLFLLFSTSVVIKVLKLKPLKVDKFDIFFSLLFGILVIFYYVGINPSNSFLFSQLKVVITFLTIVLLFIFEFSKSVSSLERLRLNASLLFTISFVLIILSGAFLLMAPNSTYKGINFVNALFTSTSAVCVTGLTVLDTAKDFTRFGQVVILMLIQVGGLGIMTFTGLLGYILSGNTTLQNQLILKDLMNAKNTAEVFGFIKKIIVGTLLIEAVGAAFIFSNIDDKAVPGGIGERLYFSVFHAVSAFCNAGFSTKTDNLYDLNLRYNYPFLTIISFLIILGGFGFPIMVNLYHYIKLHIIRRYDQIFNKKKFQHLPRLIQIQTFLVIGTTLFLLIFGTIAFYCLEYNNTLKEHTGFWGKLAVSFLGSVTPRTAGFNSVNMGELRLTTILITFLLMWIGASPASTGGGIKTTTFAIATMHYFNIARGKFKLEFRRREISKETVNKALAVISLSFVILGFSIFLISFFEAQNDKFLHIAFEAFSAYGTVGLSLNFTASLSIPSKLVLVFTMLIGRVGVLTILAGFIPAYKRKSFQYPKEDIVI